MCGSPVQAPNHRSLALEWLDARCTLPGANRDSLADTATRLAERVIHGSLQTVGLCGAPGSGKSTLAALLCHLLQRSGLPSQALCVDDYYLARRQRNALAIEVHPLLMQRGVPGTHDLALLLSDFDNLHAGDPGQAVLPVFDKSADDRAGSRAPPLTRPAVLVLEGWFVGSAAAAGIPDSEFLGREDANGKWRLYVLERWQAFEREFDNRLQETWFLRDPGWEQVLDWRWQQEQQLARPRLRSPGDVSEFLQTFQPLYELIRSHMPDRADVLIDIDPDHVLHITE
jgi:D-glycerate 3-kinase